MDNEPLCDSMIRFEIGNPTPEPCFLYETKGSRISFICSSVIPHPSSLMVIESISSVEESTTEIFPLPFKSIDSDAFLTRLI